MRRERILRIIVGSPEEVERRANDLLAEWEVVNADRVFVRHWGTDPVSLAVYIERGLEDFDIEICEQEPIRVRRRKPADTEVEAAKELGLA